MPVIQNSVTPARHAVGGRQINRTMAPDPDMFHMQQFRKQTEMPHELTLANMRLQPEHMRQQRFDKVFGVLANQLNGGGQAQYSVGGQDGPAPEITVGPMWNGQQIQQQVNASRASTDQAANSQQRANQQRLGAQGFGSRSPLLQALNMGVQNNALATNVGNERDIRMQSRQQNADQIFRTQQARSNQFSDAMQRDIERRRNMTSYNNALLGALSGLV